LLSSPPRLCRVSGLYGSFRCSGCQSIYYANKKLQQEDWQLLKQAKAQGGPGADELSALLSQKCYTSNDNQPTYKCHFIEYEIVTEPAKTSTQSNPSDDTEPPDDVEIDTDEDEKIKEQNRKIIEHYTRSTQRFDNAEFENNEDWIVSESQKDTFFKNFLRVTSQEPEQILRYYEDKELEPLWVSSQNRPSLVEHIKKCECGAERVCEFQVMPQLLYLLQVEQEEDAMDWGTLVVYTCKNSCCGKTYSEEFLWSQQISSQ